MNQKQFKQNILGLFLCFITFSGVSGCDEYQDFKNLIDHINTLRVEVKKQSIISPYKGPQFTALKEYFSEIEKVALALKNDRNFAKRFNVIAAQNKVNNTCSQVLLTKIEWQFIMGKCNRNRFFLCSEEVKAYPEMVLTIRDILTPEMKKIFDESPACSAALND